jgi:hypothetical protein
MAFIVYFTGYLFRDRVTYLYSALDFCSAEGACRIIGAITKGAANTGKKAMIVC